MDLHTFHLHTHSALHCGTGQSAGIVDLPIARDKATSLPLVPGSSLRGVLRKEITDLEDKKKQEKGTTEQSGDEKQASLAEHLFGPRNIAGSEESFAGALSIGDANLLILPVRSLAGIVAYATCPFILKQYQRDIQRPNKDKGSNSVEANIAVPSVDENKALCTSEINQLKTGTVILEDLDITVESNDEKQKLTKQWAEFISQRLNLVKDEETDFVERFIVLPDNVFSYLSTTATEIRTRIRINEETGVVQKGALWTEENLPSGAVLWGVYSVTDSRVVKKDKDELGKNKSESLNKKQLLEKINKDYLLQLGGNSGIGRGLASIYFNKGGK